MGEEKELKVANKSEKTEQEGPSYNDLKNYCSQLLMQNEQLSDRLRQTANILNKLPWLFKVVELKDMFDGDFVGSCVKEIKMIMTPPVEEDKESKD